MRRWQPASAPDLGPAVMAGLVGHLGDSDFGQSLLDDVQEMLPAASLSVYRAGRTTAPALFMSASRGVVDTTRDCWRAYMSGPYRHDSILQRMQAQTTGAPLLCHITADEVPREHRAKIYEAHGMSERVSVLERQSGGAVFAVNFYRHRHQRPFTDAALDRFGSWAPVLLALVRKHLALAAPPLAGPAVPGDVAVDYSARLQKLCPALTERERAVCVRMLQGLTLEGIASDLGVALPTVKTYRCRAFERLGIHFRNELFARVLAA